MPGLPVVPAVSCSTIAGAIGLSGLGSLCSGGGVLGAASGVVSGIAGIGVDGLLGGVASWVGSGAAWLLGQVGSLLGSTTDIDLSASWFTVHESAMVALAGVVAVPLLLFGTIQSLVQQSLSRLVRLALLHVPLALLLTAVAVKLVQLGLALTDAMSAGVADGAGVDVSHSLADLVQQFQSVAVDPSLPTFVLLLLGLIVAGGALLLWLELVVRSAAVYAAVLFLPLALASLAWPAISHWCRRLVDTLVALVLSKFVIVSVLSMAVAALAGGLGSTPAGASGGQGGGVGSVVTGTALLLLAAGAPWALFRLLPFAADGSVHQLEGAGRRSVHAVAGPVKGLAETALGSAGGVVTGGRSELARALGRGGGVGPSWRPGETIPRFGGGSDGPEPGGGGSGGAGPAPSGGTSGGGGGNGSAGRRSGGQLVPVGQGPGGGQGGDDRRSTPPDLGRSSLDRWGVGPATVPGADVPGHHVHLQAGEAYAAALRHAASPGADASGATAGPLALPGPSTPGGGVAPDRVGRPDLSAGDRRGSGHGRGDGSEPGERTR